MPAKGFQFVDSANNFSPANVAKLFRQQAPDDDRGQIPLSDMKGW